MHTHQPPAALDRSSLVTKSNALINATFDLSLRANRFLAFAISLLDRHQAVSAGQSVEIEIPVLEFARAFEVEASGNIYRELEALADQLQRKIITLQPHQTLRGSRAKFGIVKRADYFDGEGRILLEFDKDLVPHLLGLKEQFTSYRLKDVYRFGSVHAWRLYELLRQHKALGKREFDVDELKAKIGLAGLYERVGNLKVRVIDPAMREINETSDIMCEYEQRKRGRKVTGFIFIIRDNQRTKSPREQIRAVANKLDDGADKAPDLAKLLREDYRVSAVQARQLSNLAVNHEATIRARLPKLKARYEKLIDKKVSLGGYVFKALKNELTAKQGSLPL